MERPDDLLDRVTVERLHRLVGGDVAELEEQGDVEPSEDDHAEQEHSDRAGVREWVQPVRTGDGSHRPLDHRRCPLEGGQGAGEPL